MKIIFVFLTFHRTQKQSNFNTNFMMQSPLNQFREIASAFRENRRNLQPIHSPGIINEDVE